MRDIKFRGKPIEDYGDVKWFYGSAVLDYEEKIAYIVSPGQGHVPVHWDSVGQFIGECDKNGKEIYEGDIDGSSGANMYVTFEDGSFGLKFEEGHKYFDNNIHWDLCKIIGNVHDNPEMLREG